MDKDEESSPSSSTPLLQEKSFIHHLLPEPSHPRAKQRTFASGIILLLILIPLWLVLFDARKEGEGLEDEVPEVGIGWIDFGSVSWGSSRESQSQKEGDYEYTTGSTESWEEYEEEEQEEIDWESQKETVLPKFSQEKVDDVEEMYSNGTFGSYVWHNTLLGLNDTEEKSQGRLIVVGDLHGSHTQLSALLSRISYSPSRDTLLHTGDLISKSPLNSSLSTLKLVRSLGIKGVRGNHDQGVLEWRMWMEAYGGLNLTLPVENTRVGLGSQGIGKGKSGPKVAEEEAEGDGEGWDGTEDLTVVEVDTSEDGKQVAEESDADSKKSRSKEKRWFWSGGGGESTSTPTSTSTDDVDADLEISKEMEAAIEKEMEEDLGISENEEDDLKEEVAEKVMDGEEELEEIPVQDSTLLASNSTTTSNSTTSHKSDFQSSSSSLSHSSNSTHPSRPSISKKPSSLDLSHGVSHSSLKSNGALLGPEYQWLTLPVSRIEELAIEVPKGWEWGGEWFELARHLEKEDVEYLKNLPLTLWIEEVKGYLVHAGLVPWSEDALPKNSKSTTIADELESTSITEFTATSEDEKSLSSSSRASILLVEQNIAPFTLQNMRTLSKKWKPSKGKRGTPWYIVWNEEMETCRSTKGCEDVNVIYGHWAGKGLTIQENTIGLDSACYQGERLTALVLPLSTSSETVSPLSSKAKSVSAYRVMKNSTSSATLDESDFEPAKGGRSRLTKRRMNLNSRSNEKRQRFGAGVVPSPSVVKDAPVASKEVSESSFQEEEVSLNGLNGWAVSVSCA